MNIRSLFLFLSLIGLLLSFSSGSVASLECRSVHNIDRLEELKFIPVQEGALLRSEAVLKQASRGVYRAVEAVRDLMENSLGGRSNNPHEVSELVGHLKTRKQILAELESSMSSSQVGLRSWANWAQARVLPKLDKAFSEQMDQHFRSGPVRPLNDFAGRETPQSYALGRYREVLSATDQQLNILNGKLASIRAERSTINLALNEHRRTQDLSPSILFDLNKVWTDLLD